MRTNWRLVEKRPQGNEVTRFGLYVSLSRIGYLFINYNVFRGLGEPEAVEIYFDSVNNRIGIKAASASRRNSFRVRKFGYSKGKVIRMLQVLLDYKIDLPATVQFYDIEIDEEGILILDLRTARVSDRVLKHRDNKKLRKVASPVTSV